MHRRRRLLIIVALLAAVACVLGWYADTEYRKAQFQRDLHLVGFSTSMIGSPREEQEHATHDGAEKLGVGLFAVYKNNP